MIATCCASENFPVAKTISHSLRESASENFPIAKTISHSLRESYCYLIISSFNDLKLDFPGAYTQLFHSRGFLPKEKNDATHQSIKGVLIFEIYVLYNILTKLLS